MLKTTLTQLHHLGVRTVRITFSGSGDSGDIDDVTYLNADHQKLSPKQDLMGDPLPLTALHHEFYDFLSKHVTCDWYNNEGGGGELTFHLEDPQKITWDLSSYYNKITSVDCDDERGCELETEDETLEALA